MNLQRFLYLLSRSVGDANALQRGCYPARLIRRARNRAIWGWLRRMGGI